MNSHIFINIIIISLSMKKLSFYNPQQHFELNINQHTHNQDQTQNRKPSMFTKYEKPNNKPMNVAELRSTISATTTNKYAEIQSKRHQAEKKNFLLKKEINIERGKVRTEADQDNHKVSARQDYDALKNRLFALENRLIQIKKSYQIRKNKNDKYCSQTPTLKTSKPKYFINKENFVNLVELPSKQQSFQIQEMAMNPSLNNNNFHNNTSQGAACEFPNANISAKNLNFNSRKTKQQESKKTIKNMIFEQSQRNSKEEIQTPISLNKNKINSPNASPTSKATYGNLQKNFMNIEENNDKNSSNCDDFLAEYVTQYEQKPLQFRHATSETNLLRATMKAKYLDNKKFQQNGKYELYYISALIKALQANKPTSFDQLCLGHLLSSYQFLCYIKNVGIQKPSRPIIRSLPPPKKKHTVIFDLDETLIHCVDSQHMGSADVCIPVIFPNKSEIKIGINIRPYTKQCLRELSKFFQVMVFTASHANYANAIVQLLDPQKQYISYKFSRQSCYKTQQGFYVKDLRIIDRKLSNILLIDNAIYSFLFQPQNGVPIVPFYDNKADLELKNLIPYIKSFLQLQDVRLRNKEIMKFEEYTKYKGPQDIITRLYK